MAGAVVLREHGELVRAGQGVHAAVDMVHVERDVAGRVHERVAFLPVLLAQCDGVRVDHVLELVAELLRRLDARRERDRVAQETFRVSYVDLRVPSHGLEAARVSAVEQGLPDADELGLVIHLDLDGRAEVLLHGGGKHVLADVHDDDLVVGQDALLHGLAEAERVAQAPVRLLVVHARDRDRAHHVGLLLRARIVDAWGSGHVHAFRRVDEPVVVDLLESALAVDDAGGAVRLIAYDQVEVGQAELLGAGDHVDGLVGGEHHVQRVVAPAEAGGDGVRVRGRGIRDVGQLAIALVVLEFGRLPVGAHDVRVDAAAHLVDPSAHGLGHEADGRGEEQDRAARAQLLRQSQRGERLACAARHDRQRPVVVLQFRLDRVDGLALVVARLEHLACVGRVAGERAPVDVRVADPFQVDARDVAVLVVRDVRLEIMAHRGRGVRDDEMLVSCVGHRRHEERGHVLV